MGLVAKLEERWRNQHLPFLVGDGLELGMAEVLAESSEHLKRIRSGDVVALIGDFNARSISDLLYLFEKNTIVVPLTATTRSDHEYFFESAYVDWVVENGEVRRRIHNDSHELIELLRSRGNPGLVLFSTGTTGRPKAILHDFSEFLKRYETVRPTFRTIGFLLFDHIGGINTILHTIFNKGIVIALNDRSVRSVLEVARVFEAEVLPTTPTFLRMLLMADVIPEQMPQSVKIVTYGTERMDQHTLTELCRLLPNVDFRQTFGMSELGILRVKSESRTSLFMKVGGEGVKTRQRDGLLEIYSPSRMLGYLNAESPFDIEGWYPTLDIVEYQDAEYFKVVGRATEVINVGGLKFLPSEVERVVLTHPSIAFVSVLTRENPITGQHIELVIEPKDIDSFNLQVLKTFLRSSLPSHMVPRRITVGKVAVGHRFKRI